MSQVTGRPSNVCVPSTAEVGERVEAGPSLIEFENIVKHYSGATALDGISLKLRAGEVHALVGENGAGKSTLVRILAGVTQPTSGSLIIDGQPVDFSSPHDARRIGVSYVSQELSLLPDRSVIENVLCGQIPTHALGMLDWKEAERTFQKLLDLSGFRLPPIAKIKSLNMAEQVFVEILRGMAGDLRVLVLDEPTTATTQDQSALILALARRLADLGVCVVLVSHELNEVLQTADFVTVLRDGKVVKTVAGNATSRTELISAMIGRDLREQYPPKKYGAQGVAPIFKAQDICRPPVLRGVSLSVQPGEILGIGGLVGSGRTGFVRCLVGADKYQAGRIEVNGKQVTLKGLSDAQRHGIVMVPENRKEQGLHLEHSIERNTSLPHLKRLSRFGFIKRKSAEHHAREALMNVNVKDVALTSPVRVLSGGNQQRVLFAKWLAYAPNVLIVDEPTRGVDVAGKRSIYQLIVDFASTGRAVILVSSEMPELIGLSHRVLVMAEGMVSAELTGDQITETNIAEAAFHTGATKSKGLS